MGERFIADTIRQERLRNVHFKTITMKRFFSKGSTDAI